MSVSFGFKKKIETKVIPSTKKDSVEGPEFLNSIEENVIQSTKPQEEKKEYIIPLIKQNRWKIPSKPSKAVVASETPHKNEEEDKLADAAAKELIEESKEFMNQEVPDEHFDNMAVPLLMKNKVPEGFEEDEKLDVSLRPDEADADYDAIPVSAYGMAMLRGMGWNELEGIGKTFKKHIKMYEQHLRPKGLGLGATAPNKDKKNKSASSNGDKDSESMELKVGAHVLAMKGSNKDKYGIVQGIDVDEGRCIVKLAIGGKSEVISQYSLQVVKKKEYEKNSKDISRLSKAYTEGKLDAIMKKDKMKEMKSHDKDNYDDDKRSQKEHKDKPHKKSHKRNASEDREDYVKKKKKVKHEKKKRSWIKRFMRVRIIDNSYCRGKYYKEKVVVEDVFGGGVCCCKTEEGRLLDDLKDDMLETVIPRSTADSYIVIVKRTSEHDGKLARMLEKNREECTAVVQLIEDRDVLLELPFEKICEYVGDVEANSMF